MHARFTPSQTVGPYLHIGLDWLASGVVVGTRGELTISGTVRDGAGAPVNDALLETWQADAHGRYGTRHGDLPYGFGRVATDADGRYALRTDLPGATDGAAPMLVVTLFMRGLLRPLVTQLYLPRQAANDIDPTLCAVPPARRATLVASGEGSELRWDIHLQGAHETVFFEV